MSKLFMSIITYQLKILYLVIFLVVILVMNYLPSVKVSAKMLGHYEAMFENISHTPSHLKEKVFRIKFDKPITSVPFEFSSFPHMIFSTEKVLDIKPTRTGKASWYSAIFAKFHPSFLATIGASKPLVIAFPFTYFFTLFNFSYNWHIHSLQYYTSYTVGVQV